MRLLRTSNRIMLIVTFCLILNSACKYRIEDPVIRKECDSWIETFFSLPQQDQIQKFCDFTIKDQYSIYICGNQVFHPPALYLADEFAKNGRAGVDFLEDKLSNTKDDLTILNIILVFEQISRLNIYDINGDTLLMRLISERIVRMTDENWRKMAEQSVGHIRQHKK